MQFSSFDVPLKFFRFVENITLIHKPDNQFLKSFCLMLSMKVSLD